LWRQSRSDLDGNTREEEERVQVDFVIIYFTPMPKLLHSMLLPACCLLTHFFLRNGSKIYDVDWFKKKLFIKNVIDNESFALNL